MKSLNSTFLSEGIRLIGYRCQDTSHLDFIPDSDNCGFVMDRGVAKRLLPFGFLFVCGLETDEKTLIVNCRGGSCRHFDLCRKDFFPESFWTDHHKDLAYAMHGDDLSLSYIKEMAEKDGYHTVLFLNCDMTPGHTISGITTVVYAFRKDRIKEVNPLGYYMTGKTQS